MRNLIITLSLLLFITTSCSSDDSDDACTPIECLNGGIETVDCGCDCSEGYAGSDCSSQIDPSAILINKITITSFPLLKPNGDYWDNSLLDLLSDDKYPDIYVQLINGTTLETLYFPVINYINVEDSLSELEFTPSEPISIQDYDDNIVLAIFDYDEDEDPVTELMDSIELDLYFNTNNFPVESIFVSESFLSNVILELSYEF
ncbi:hypothetical protein [Psychroflexus planctonicus]|uniref:EGF-like domain-containing protein n=1 Tax=Psychroflexus planctonicus TaxID=1526575 RepID=A0ABQ1SFW6_9FLAO|nr:hypothetical protein [Psychroflexus planctonicus]GGE31610.1 hypothetical protein GCM10010832_09930 [Psychroflexus planctonicus]